MAYLTEKICKWYKSLEYNASGKSHLGLQYCKWETRWKILQMVNSLGGFCLAVGNLALATRKSDLGILEEGKLTFLQIGNLSRGFCKWEISLGVCKWKPLLGICKWETRQSKLQVGNLTGIFCKGNLIGVFCKWEISSDFMQVQNLSWHYFLYGTIMQTSFQQLSKKP